jgi:hypothetical protein
MSIEKLQKTNLAKLLATENITVQHRKVDTAYFDVKNRILCLPIWKDEMPNDVYDLLVGHEVGHALFTPSSDWAFKQKEVPVSFLNVLEDVRIEKMMKQKFPGLRKNFYNGYQTLSQRDFFGIKDKEINQLKFIDRLNIHYKIGAFAQVPFKNEIEMNFVKRSFETETFDDVFNLAKEIYAYEKAEQKKQQEQPQDSGKNQKQGTEKSDTEQMTQPDNTGDNEQEQAQVSPGEEGEDDDGLEVLKGEGDFMPENKDTDQDEKASTGKKGGQSNDNELEASTDSSMNEKMKELLDEDSKDYQYVTLPKPNLESIVVPHKELYAMVKEQDSRYKDISDINNLVKTEFKKFKDSSMKTVNYLVKEFEMKKSADAYRRANISKTGVINVNKLHSYKFNDDIFKKLTIIPDGKNHGMSMFIDWSGSMHKSFYETVTQLFNLIFFCQQVNIPFEVYAFTDRSTRSFDSDRSNKPTWLYKNNDKLMDNFNLLQLFSSDMNKAEFNNACIEIYKVALCYGEKLYTSYHYYYSPCRILTLGGTPLNAAILASIHVIKNFQKKHNIQKMNTIFLTDGESHDQRDFLVDLEEGDNKDSWKVRSDCGLKIGYMSNNTSMIVSDNKTKYSFKMSYINDVTSHYFEILKRKVDTTLIGFHIVHRKLEIDSIGKISGKGYATPMAESEKIKLNFRQNKFVISTKNGYDEQYFIKGSKDLEVNDEGFKVDPNKKTSLVAAFKKYSKNKVMSRVLLNKFIEKVA